MLVPSTLGRDLDKAAGYLSKAIGEDPFSPEPHVRLAQIYKVRGDMEKYRQYLDKALELDPDDELALDIKNGACKFICPDEPKE